MASTSYYDISNGSSLSSCRKVVAYYYACFVFCFVGNKFILKTIQLTVGKQQNHCAYYLCRDLLCVL